MGGWFLRKKQGRSLVFIFGFPISYFGLPNFRFFHFVFFNSWSERAMSTALFCLTSRDRSPCMYQSITLELSRASSASAVPWSPHITAFVHLGDHEYQMGSKSCSSFATDLILEPSLRKPFLCICQQFLHISIIIVIIAVHFSIVLLHQEEVC